MRVVAVGTGAALRLASRGDAVLVHAPEQEKREADISVGNAAAKKYDGDHQPEEKRKYADGRHGANDGTIS